MGPVLDILPLADAGDAGSVLDAVVTEAMRLVKNARTAHIFLYENGKLEFGAALNDDGRRNTPLALPRPVDGNHDAFDPRIQINSSIPAEPPDQRRPFTLTFTTGGS